MGNQLDFLGLILNRKIFYCFLVITVAASSFAADITGLTLDVETGSPLQGAHIRICGTNWITVTDETGRFSLENIPSGWHRLQVVANGYITIDEDVYIRPEDTREMFIAMAVDSQGSEDLQIVLTWRGPWNSTTECSTSG